MAKVLLCRTGDVYAGGIVRVETDALPPVAVYNLDGDFYTADDTCSHGQAWLSQGFVDGDINECPFHGGCFEIKTGRPGLPAWTPFGAATSSSRTVRSTRLSSPSQHCPQGSRQP